MTNPLFWLVQSSVFMFRLSELSVCLSCVACYYFGCLVVTQGLSLVLWLNFLFWFKFHLGQEVTFSTTDVNKDGRPRLPLFKRWVRTAWEEGAAILGSFICRVWSKDNLSHGFNVPSNHSCQSLHQIDNLFMFLFKIEAKHCPSLYTVFGYTVSMLYMVLLLKSLLKLCAAVGTCWLM